MWLELYEYNSSYVHIIHRAKCVLYVTGYDKKITNWAGL